MPDAVLADVPASLRGPAEPTRGATGSAGNGSVPRRVADSRLRNGLPRRAHLRRPRLGRANRPADGAAAIRIGRASDLGDAGAVRPDRRRREAAGELLRPAGRGAARRARRKRGRLGYKLPAAPRAGQEFPSGSVHRPDANRQPRWRVGPTTPKHPTGLPLAVWRLDRLRCCRTITTPTSARVRLRPHASNASSNSGAAVTSQALPFCAHQRRDTAGSPASHGAAGVGRRGDANEKSVYLLWLAR